REVLGKSFLEAFPELQGTEMQAIVERVYRTGEPFVIRELSTPLRNAEGVVETRHHTFNLAPIRNGEGAVTALMVVAVDMTEQVAARLSLERTDEERRRLLDAADAAARAKDEFLAMLGHELRNPLAPIMTALHLLKSKETPDIRREREIIERQATHLIHLVDDLLDASRVAQGKIELKRSHVALSEVVAMAVEMAAPLFEKKNHRLLIDVPKAGLDLHADPMRLAQVVSNLLTNAARYTKAGGNIALTARREQDFALLKVEDNGIGIAPEHVAQLFNMFFQAPQRRDRAEGGLGLGLALAKSLIELHGGNVSASSPGLGLGSVFEVRVPLAERPPEPLLEPAPSPGVFRSGPSPSVLLVDDNRDLADMLAQFLEEAGCVVWTAHDGPSALALAKDVRPAVAVIDIGLPVMDGYELATSLREALSSAQPRLIAMTGYGEAEDRRRSESAGFQCHLVKPVDVGLLLRALLPPATD
ncbi:MAG TPA: ATP-binding protein, partial [Polyangiaceae bacterium]|nr:ATP-binding protein [Polyangiaceae bacterium]